MAVNPPHIQPPRLQPLPVEFYRRPVLEVSRDLIGAVLVRRAGDVTLSCRIVETEAYAADDPASHSRNGPTRRNASMFQAGGIAYVYLIYGVHTCLNVVVGAEGDGCAVLIRAGEPLCGIRTMWENRFPDSPFDAAKIKGLTNGPGKLCAALKIDRRRHDGMPLTGGELFVGASGDRNPEHIRIDTSPRIGITAAVERPWRFFETGNRFVSR